VLRAVRDENVAIAVARQVFSHAQSSRPPASSKRRQK